MWWVQRQGNGEICACLLVPNPWGQNHDGFVGSITLDCLARQVGTADASIAGAGGSPHK